LRAKQALPVDKSAEAIGHGEQKKAYRGDQNRRTDGGLQKDHDIMERSGAHDYFYCRQMLRLIHIRQGILFFCSLKSYVFRPWLSHDLDTT